MERCPRCGAKTISDSGGVRCGWCGWIEGMPTREPNSKQPEENLVVEKCDPRN